MVSKDGPRRRVVDPLARRRRVRWLIRAAVVLGAILAARIWAPRILPEIALAQIGEITNTRIEAKDVTLNINGTVRIRGLRVSPFTRTAYDNTILRARSVRARFSLMSLLTLRPQLKEITVNGFVLSALYDVTADRWNVTEVNLEIPEGGGGRLPSISLANGRFQYIKVFENEPMVSFEVPMDVQFGREDEAGGRYRFEVATAAEGRAGRNTLHGFWSPGRLALAGSFRSTHLPTVERTYDIESVHADLTYDEGANFKLSLEIENLFGARVADTAEEHFVVPEFIKRSGPVAGLQAFFGQLRPWGRIDIALEASGNLKNPAAGALSGNLRCRDVYLWDRGFAYKLDHMTGDIAFTNETAQLQGLQAKHGDVVLHIGGGTRKLDAGWQYEVTIHSENMRLDQDLYEALNAGQREFWEVFWPKGTITFESRVRGGPDQGPRTDMKVDLRNIEATCRFFPYPLENITGTLLFGPGEITFSDLHSDFDGRQVDVAGAIRFPRPRQPRYEITVDVNDIPLDEVLAAALPEQQRGAYRQFSPTGYGSGRVQVFNHPADPNTFSFTGDLAFRDGSLTAEQPPLHITDVTAEARFTPETIEVRRLDGRHAGGAVSVEGLIRPGADVNDHQYQLRVIGRRAQLGPELMKLVPETYRHIMDRLGAQGEIDYTAKLDAAGGTTPVDYDIAVTCLNNHIAYDAMPYPLKDVTGVVKIHKGQIILEDVRARPGDTVWVESETSALGMSGLITLVDGRFGGANVAVTARDIYFDEQLGRNLPQGIRVFYDRLRPSGRFDADYPTVCVWANPDGAPSFDFEGDMRFKNCSFGVSGAEAVLDGVVGTAGTYKAGTGFSACHVKLNADSLVLQGQTFSRVRADAAYDPAAGQWTTERIAAECYGGRIAGKGRFHQHTDGALDYTVQMAFLDVDLGQFLGHTQFAGTAGAREAVGRMTGSLNLSARLGDSSTRIGSCRLTVDTMRLGKLPPLTNLLYVLKLSRPEDYAFNSVYLNSYILRDSLVVQRLDLAGPALAFYGSGLVDLRSRNVDLILAGRGQRLASADPTVLASFTEHLGQAIVRMEVTGSLYDPKVATKPLPLFEDSFRLLQRYHVIPIP